MNPLTIFHTVRWLKPAQLASQIRFRLGRMLPSVSGPVSPPGLVSVSETWHPEAAVFGRGIRRHGNNSLLSGDFEFLNERDSIGFPPDWDAPGRSKLWQYNLHYFEYLWSLEFDDAALVVSDWMERHPMGPDQVGWEPYPVSLRLQNWSTYFLGLHSDLTRSDDDFMQRLLNSMAMQLRHLERRLEYHLLGNHLFENAATLCLVGSCLDLPGVARIKTRGLDILAKQLREQILPDGCHFERSPMYQARLTYLLTQLQASGDAAIRKLVDGPLEKMGPALRRLTHPDGEIALFNDAAFGIAPRAADLVEPEVDAAAFSLSEAGYYGALTEQGDYVVVDAGPIGPDYLPGHAHGDIFSFELSMNGSRVIVDSGTHDYLASEMRRYCRSTRAHNTVEIGGADQCEFWGVFRVARRGRPRDVAFDLTPGGFTLAGWHDGYRRLAGKPVHARSLRWSGDGVLVVRDRISSSRPVSAVSRLHLHPACKILKLEEHEVSIGYPGGTFVVAWRGEGRLATENSWYCPEFGVRLQNSALAFAAEAPCDSVFCIAPTRAGVSFEI